MQALSEFEMCVPKVFPNVTMVFIETVVDAGTVSMFVGSGFVGMLSFCAH